MDRVQRRMAAVLAADVVGYSRLMGANEAATLTALKLHRHEIIDAKIAEHDGRIVKLTGDGMLVEFPSVVNAIACAAEIQRGMHERNADVPTDKRMEFRVGVTIGDVIVEGDDIFGDGVNVAARLEAIADPGGLAISATARDHVGRRLDLTFEDMGEQALKNIDQPIHVWKWHPAKSAGKGATPIVPSKAESGDLPSLAVLPFQNMSGDAEQDYFADGMVEDLITALSRFKSFAVIARNSSFIYKGRAVDVRQVARELAVRYVLEGSVRRSANRLRITAQLVDGATGSHLWANKFDGAVEDIFDVQDKITEGVVAVVEPNIQRAEIERSRRERPESLTAYDLYLRGLQKFYTMQPEENAAALELFDRAIELEGGYAAALAAAAHCLEHRVSLGWPQVTSNDAEKALRLARAALSVAGDDAVVLARCGIVLLQVGMEDEQGMRVLNRALEVNPNNVGVQFLAGGVHGVMPSGQVADDSIAGALNRVRRLLVGPSGSRVGIETLHQAQQEIADMADAAARAGRNRQAGLLRDVRSQLMEEMNAATTKNGRSLYGDATRQFADESAVMDALREGQGVFARPFRADALRQQLGRMGPDQRAAYIQGARDNVAAIMDAAGPTMAGNADSQAAWKRLLSEENMEKMRLLFGDDEAASIRSALNREAGFGADANRVLQNSATARREAARDLYPNPADRSASVFTVAPSMWGRGEAIAQGALNMARGVVRRGHINRTNRGAADLLTTPLSDPVMEALVQQLARRQQNRTSPAVARISQALVQAQGTQVPQNRPLRIYLNAGERDRSLGL